jgi:hypothetical protein
LITVIINKKIKEEINPPNNFARSELLNWSLNDINVPNVINEKTDDKNSEVWTDDIFFFSLSNKINFYLLKKK